MIDIDNYMEFLAWKNGRNIDKVASKIGDVKDILSIDDASKLRKKLSIKSHEFVELDLKNAIDGVIPLCISMVGMNADNKLLKIKEQLESIGYDTMCVYIKQSAKHSYEGNERRYLRNIENPRSGKAAREVNQDYISVAAEKLPEQIEIIKKAFENKFVEVEKKSNNYASMFNSASYKNAIKHCSKFLSSPIENDIGKNLLNSFKLNPGELKYLQNFSTDMKALINTIAKNITNVF